MTDCSNAEIRDQLPDYVNDLLSPADAAVVASHVASCGECSEEVALLRAVRAVRPRGASVDVASIVAKLPKSAVADRTVRPITSAPSIVARSSGVRAWSAIAAVAVVAIGSLSLYRNNNVGTKTNTVSSSETSYVAVKPGVASNVAATGESAKTPSVLRNAKEDALSVGELTDYSDAEIEAVMARLDKWDGAASADPLPGVPIIPASSSGGVP